MSNPPSVKFSRNLRDVIAIALALAALVIGWVGMFMGEARVDPSAPGGFQHMLQGMMTYCNAFGILLLLAGIAFLLVGYRDQIATSLTRPNDDE
ncbi:MAG: hypothetical protein AB7P76_02600 [Candidatus Melainabacteria bacterium]